MTDRNSVQDEKAVAEVPRAGGLREPRPTAAARLTKSPFTASVRIPVVPKNRKLLRALRAAELASWERARAQATIESSERTGATAYTARMTAAALKSSAQIEGALYLIVTLSASAALLLSLRTALHVPAHWPNFVELVRRVLE